MAQITLRGIDPQIEGKIRMMAKKTGKSLNRIILDMIYQQTGLSKKGKKGMELYHYKSINILI